MNKTNSNTTKLVNLRIPGPVPLPEEVIEAGTTQMFNHRSAEFTTLLERVLGNLKQVYQTKGDVFVITSSGTGGMEAAIVNTLKRGDKVVSVNTGWFGDRFVGIAKGYGGDVEEINFSPGNGAEPDVVFKQLKAIKDVKIVLITHNESSSGVCNPLKELCEVVKNTHPKALILVDAISSVGGIEVAVDSWGIDVLVSASQKSLLSPPGVALVSFSENAWNAYDRADKTSSYFDLGLYKKHLANGHTPFTPALSVIASLDYSLNVLVSNGIENALKKHARAATKVRSGALSLGLEILAEERFFSNTVTAIKSPPNVDVKNLIKRVKTNHNVVLGGGMGILADKIFRVGHMGWADDFAELDDALEGVARELESIKHNT